jgi:hypothetical protein
VCDIIPATRQAVVGLLGRPLESHQVRLEISYAPV